MQELVTEKNGLVALLLAGLGVVWRERSKITDAMIDRLNKDAAVMEQVAPAIASMSAEVKTLRESLGATRRELAAKVDALHELHVVSKQ